MDAIATAERMIQMFPTAEFTFPHFGKMPHRVKIIAECLEIEQHTNWSGNLEMALLRKKKP